MTDSLALDVFVFLECTACIRAGGLSRAMYTAGVASSLCYSIVRGPMQLG
jgi:hypothetical protein